jgi:hypothetical protein
MKHQDVVKWNQWFTSFRAENLSAPWASADAVPKTDENHDRGFAQKKPTRRLPITLPRFSVAEDG